MAHFTMAAGSTSSPTRLTSHAQLRADPWLDLDVMHRSLELGLKLAALILSRFAHILFAAVGVYSILRLGIGS